MTRRGLRRHAAGGPGGGAADGAQRTGIADGHSVRPDEGHGSASVSGVETCQGTKPP